MHNDCHTWSLLVLKTGKPSPPLNVNLNGNFRFGSLSGILATFQLFFGMLGGPTVCVNTSQQLYFSLSCVKKKNQASPVI